VGGLANFAGTEGGGEGSCPKEIVSLLRSTKCRDLQTVVFNNSHQQPARWYICLSAHYRLRRPNSIAQEQTSNSFGGMEC